MNVKKIIAIVLGLFVLFSVAFLIVTERQKVTDKNQQPQTAPVKMGTYVEGLYFHGTNRCFTCNKMEGFIRDVLKESFTKEVNEGRVSFQSLNVDEPSYNHYVNDYQLQSTSFFLSLKKDGKEIKFKNADKIWQLASNEAEFKNYIKAEIKSYMEM